MSQALALRLANEVPTLANLDAEQALIGAAMYDVATVAAVDGQIAAEHFAEPFHGWLWSVIIARAGKGEIVDPVSLHHFAQSQGEAYESFGGIMYLAQLVDRAPPPANAPDYARLIFDCHIRRTVLQACREASQAALRDRDRPAFEIVAALRQQAEDIENAGAPEDASMISAPDAAVKAIAAMEELARSGRVRGKMTGLRCTDRRLGGLRPGVLIVIGGRPGMGKTALARAIMHGAAVRNPNDEFLFCGIEMGPEEMMQRELSALTHEHWEGVEYQAMAKGALTPMDLQVLDLAAKRVPPNLTLDDCHSLSLEDIRRKVWSVARRARKQGRKLAAVAIDYLQLMRRPAAQGRNEATVLGEITAGLKLLARQTGVAIILLSQLSRAVESREDKRPQLSDLRESGSIEQDADVVLFPFREVYYVERAEPPKSDASKYADWEMRCHDLRRTFEVICAKQRQGPVGADKQRYFAEFDFIEDEHEHA